MRKMNNKSILITLLLLLFCSLTVTAQQQLVEIRGKVVDVQSQAPIAGAMVRALQDSELSVATDSHGEFVIRIPSNRDKLQVWSSGYFNAEVPVLNRSEITIHMIPSNKLDYTNESLVPFMGAVTNSRKISVAESNANYNVNLNTTSVEQILRTMTGMSVTDKSGMSGEGSYFYHRGNNSFAGTNTPLIVLNGMPMVYDEHASMVISGYSNGILNSISARDIKNITVLKGADAAIYGSMASSGVILIETEEAVDLDTRVEFSGQYGVAMNQKTLPVLGVDGYKKLVGNVALSKYDDMANILTKFPFLVDDPDYYYKYLYNNNTDWQDKIYRTGFVTDNTLRIRGGDAIAKYDVALGYTSVESQLIGNKYDRYYARLKSDVNLSRKFQLFTNVGTTYSTNDLLDQGMSQESNPLMAALRKGPIFSPFEKDEDNNLRPEYATIRDADGNLVENNMVSNPLALVNLSSASYNTYDIQLNGGLNFQWNPYLKLTGAASMYYVMNRENFFLPGLSKTSIMPMEGGLARNTVRAGVSEIMNVYGTVNATYTRSFNYVHDFQAAVAAQFSVNKHEYDGGSGRNTTSDFYQTISNVENIGRVIFGYNEKWNWLNFNANFRYIYNSTIGINAALSYDGSSSIGNDANRMNLYPAVGVALYGKSLNFLKDVSWVDQLNIRADYTTTGNSRYSSVLSKYYYESQRYREISGIVRGNIPNTELNAEINRTFSLSADLGLLNDRLAVTATYYLSRVDDVILPRQISPAFGFSTIYENMGEIENKGVELGFRITPLQNRNVTWNLGGSITFNKNKVVSLGNTSSLVHEMEDGSALISQVGKSMYEFYGYQTNGVYASQSAADNEGLKNPGGVQFGEGDMRFVDQDANKIINLDDRVSLGSASPDYFGTFYTQLQYKKFGLSATFGYSYGNKAYNAVRRELESMKDFGNQAVSVSTRWTMDGQVTDMPKATYGDPMANSRFSDRWIEDASYLKLKEVMISYKLDLLNGVTVYLSGENLFTVTKYLGLDPEFMYSYNPMLQGFDYAKIAHPRRIKFGFKIQF